MAINKRSYISTAIAVYVSFLLCGIDMSITAQYKVQLAQVWGQGSNISSVLTVNSAVGIGGIVASLFTGVISDHFGRKSSAIISSLLWAAFAFGMLYAPNMGLAYLAGVAGGVANSFTNAAWTPSMMDAYPKKRSLVTLLTKFFVSLGQFILPFIIVALAASKIPFSVAFNFLGILYVIIAIISIFLPFPEVGADNQANSNEGETDKKAKLRITGETIALALMGFSSTAVFMIWTQTNQELGKLYGLSNPALLQSVYAITSLISVLVTSWMVTKGLKETTVLILYPAFSAIALLLAYFIHNGALLFLVAALMGWFAAGGLMQLAVSLLSGLYPSHKATATSAIGLANGISNWGVIQIAAIITAKLGQNAPRDILLFNFIICLIGIVLALIVRKYQSARIKNGISNLE
ncbi:MFS family permease [Lactobacillus colini]|uniref:MFS family permease n=1 Tax=Lactobacillus colini TaxID=1819254 RepID=A0ABS4MB22_9LACO|nr:MFS transporter [Lactobacillus colini]MBP2056875.1 MFS family permease [Lactobacillus colini]